VTSRKVARSASLRRPWRWLSRRLHPLSVAVALLLVLLTLLAWLQLSYRPPPAVFSTAIRDGEVVILGPSALNPPNRLDLPVPRLAAMAPAPPVPAGGSGEPRPMRTGASMAAPLPLVSLPTTAVLPRRPPPPQLAEIAVPPLAAGAPRALPTPAWRPTAPPRTPGAGGTLKGLAAMPAAPVLAPFPPSRPAAGRPASAAEAGAVPSALRRPRIAIVLWGLGRSREASEAAIHQLPAEVTLGLTPHGRDLQFWADRARAAGHEVVLEIPMEPLSYPEVDPGKQALLTTLPAAENRQRLERLLAAFHGYIGTTNFMGSRFTTSEAHLRPVLETLKARGLIFLDSRANDQSIAYRLAGEIGLDRAVNNRYIDNEASGEAIDARLAELAQVALKDGTAVGIGLPRGVTIERLGYWLSGVQEKGLQLAPLSAVVEQGRRE